MCEVVVYLAKVAVMCGMGNGVSRMCKMKSLGVLHCDRVI